MTQFLYNPDQKSKKQLIEEFVVRTEVLDDIMNDIETSDMSKPEQHYLIVGQRGSGKTTLLHRIKYAIEDSEKLNTWLIPVTFGEEQYNITELANLWENIAHYLEDYHQFEGLTFEMEKHIEKNNFDEYCFDILQNALNGYKKRVILLIDNIGDLLKKIGRKEVQRLREVLQTSKYLRLIAGSPYYLESILDYSQPFFEFFKIQRLDGLNRDQAEKLLLKLGEIHDQKQTIERIIKETPERIETLRILTSGVPRTIGLMFRIFIDHEHESSMKDLERILDAVTPLYKHRMDELPTQQQKIVDAVAKNWDAVSVKDLKSKVRLDSKIISAQLRQLEKNQIIEKRETSTKNHLYLLKERFWNIWYLMRYGRRTDNERVIWLVRFLESWCSTDDFENRIISFTTQISNGKLDEETKILYGTVYASLTNITSNQKYLLKKHISKKLADKINLSESEAVDLANKYSLEGNHPEAIGALLQTNELCEANKRRIATEINSIDFSNVLSIGTQILTLGDTNNDFDFEKDGYLTFVIELTFRAIVISLVNNDFENASVLINSTVQIIYQSGREKEMNFEYISIAKIIAVLIMNKQFSLAIDLFDKLDDLDLKDKIKPYYYCLLYFAEGPESDKLKLYGNEVVDSAMEKVNTFKKYWIDESDILSTK